MWYRENGNQNQREETPEGKLGRRVPWILGTVGIEEEWGGRVVVGAGLGHRGGMTPRPCR